MTGIDCRAGVYGAVARCGGVWEWGYPDSRRDTKMAVAVESLREKEQAFIQ